MVTIRVPATTANLGPGFDCLGMALSLYAEFTFTLQDHGLAIIGCPAEFSGEDNLIHQAFLHAARQFGQKAPGLSIAVNSAIPPARGLGSSAACITAGIMAAGQLLDVPLSQDDLFSLSAALEGHPDNAAAAVCGGIRVSLMTEGRATSLPVHPHPEFAAAGPDPGFSLETAKARQALPDHFPRQEVVFNLSHTAFLVKALEEGAASTCWGGLPGPAAPALPLPLIDGGEALARQARALGADACVISGAGPSLLCLHHDPASPARMADALKAYPAWRALPLNVAEEGPLSSQNRGTPMLNKDILIGIMIPFLGTFLGAGVVLFMKGEMKPWFRKTMLGFASGVMMAASVWSLLLPAIEKSEELGALPWLPPRLAFWAAWAFCCCWTASSPTSTRGRMSRRACPPTRGRTPC